MVGLGTVIGVEMRMDLDSILERYHCNFVLGIHLTPNPMHCNVNWINQISDWLHWLCTLHTNRPQSEPSPLWNSFSDLYLYVVRMQTLFFLMRLFCTFTQVESLSVSKLSLFPINHRESWLILHRIGYGNEQNVVTKMTFIRARKIEYKLFKFWSREQGGRERAREKKRLRSSRVYRSHKSNIE